VKKIPELVINQLNSLQQQGFKAHKHLPLQLFRPVMTQSNPMLEIGTHVIEINSLAIHPKFILMTIKSLEIVVELTIDSHLHTRYCIK